MAHTIKGVVGRQLELFAKIVCRWTGGSGAFALACSVVVVWLLSGPFFGYSDTWQLVINTGTTVVTFLMVFLIQRSQNKESLAVQLKLNEIVAAAAGRQQPADRRRGPDRGGVARPAPPLRETGDDGPHRTAA